MKNKILLPFFLAIALVVGLYLGKNTSSNSSSFFSGFSKSNKVEQLIELIDENYVDNVNTDSILDVAVNQIMESLDPHSIYIAPKEAESVAESMRGDFVGIGINFYIYKDSLTVVNTLPGSPCDKIGIKQGDRLLYAGKKPLFGKEISNDTVFKFLKGERGSEVALKWYRKTTNKTYSATIKRDIVPIKSVDTYLMLNDSVGYIKLNRFSESSYTEFNKALSALKKQNCSKLIFDLRDNGGGYMEIASKIIDDFLSDNKLIVKTIDKNNNSTLLNSTKLGDFINEDLVILINENSASASEIVAGAIQDHDRGWIVGRRSFGKGLVQKEMPLADGSVVRLTVSRYYTPSGRSIQKPYKDKGEEYFNEFLHRFEEDSLYNNVSDSLKFKTKKGRIVFGGGGIVPDIRFPYKTDVKNQSDLQIINSGLLDYFVFETIDKDRKLFSTLSQQELLLKLEQEDYYKVDYRTYIATSGYLINYRKIDAEIELAMQAAFTKSLFGEKAFYKTKLATDEMIIKALELKGRP